MPPRPRKRATSKAAAKAPAAFSAIDNPITRRIGPIFDPAWLKLVKEETLREIAIIQLDGVKEMLEVERKAVEQIRQTIKGR
jgi:hypothetical protein